MDLVCREGMQATGWRGRVWGGKEKFGDGGQRGGGVREAGGSSRTFIRKASDSQLMQTAP